MSVKLTQADLIAIERDDSSYINDKGAKYYAAENYEKAIEYYRLGAAMGNEDSLSNLGYCYMYARSIPQNMSLALAYFKIAASKDNIDALYKLGNIYKNGADGIQADNETALYYYLRALTVIETNYPEAIFMYPSLYLSIAREFMPGGSLLCDLERAYNYLEIAKKGYENEVNNGTEYHRQALETVIELLNSPCFDMIRKSRDKSEIIINNNETEIK